VLVTRTLGAIQRRLLTGRRPKQAEPEPEPEPVVTARATLVDVKPMDASEAGAWLKGADLDAETEAGLATLNRVVHAARVVAGDPYMREVASDQALVIRVGFGEGEQVADGRWTDARELPKGRNKTSYRRAAALRPQERLAALLSGRDVALACEELILRARADWDAGRSREAAFQVRVALEAAIAELEPWVDRPSMVQRLDALRGEREAVGAAANAALEGGLGDEALENVERCLRRIEAALRARTAAGFE
jgi:hypothetical protein